MEHQWYKHTDRHEIGSQICKNHIPSLDGGFKYFLCSTLFGEDGQFDEHIFQMSWINSEVFETDELSRVGVASERGIPLRSCGCEFLFFFVVEKNVFCNSGMFTMASMGLVYLPRFTIVYH